jgi:hypothetical protein
VKSRNSSLAMKWKLISISTLFISALVVHIVLNYPRTSVLDDSLDISASTKASATEDSDDISRDDAGDDWRRKAKAAGDLFYTNWIFTYCTDTMSYFDLINRMQHCMR